MIDDFGNDDIDEGDAFVNTLVRASENLMGELLRPRATVWAAMNEQDFVRLFGMVRTVFDQWLGPDELRNLWDQIAWRYHEYRREEEPAVEAEECEKFMQELSPEWYAIVHAAREDERKRKEGKRKTKPRKKGK